MSNCTSSCETQDHETWGECVKAKSLKVAGVNATVNGTVISGGDN